VQADGDGDALLQFFAPLPWYYHGITMVLPCIYIYMYMYVYIYMYMYYYYCQ
jgi:hypothetical protein